MASSKEQILQSAEKFLARGKLEQALKEYLRLLDENPNDVATLNRVGDLYVRMNRPADSIQFYTRIADAYSLDGFFLKGIAILKKINKIDPSRLDIYEKLADLYHKQGLSQDARSQYQVLADHYQKGGKHKDTIAAYKKMADVDPNDMKIQVRLADLYRSHNQTEQAVMQYGLVGSMLLRRGAHDEAAAVFQKALEISPNDANIQKSLVRSLLAQKNAAAAIAILRAAPRTADSLALLAEAQLDLGHKADAIKTAEQAIALDAKHEASRSLLSRIRVLEGSFEQAYAAIAPSVDAATAARDFPRAAGYLGAILDAEPEHRPSLEKMAEVREAEGNAREAATLRVSLGMYAERQGDRAAAVESYRRALKAQPDNREAMERIRQLVPGEPAPAAPAAPRPLQSAAGLEQAGAPAPDAGPGSSPMDRPRPTAGPPPQGGLLEEQEIGTLVVEAEVFAKYGLTDKAVERLRSLVRSRPELTQARERLVDLMAESKNSALAQEARGLADVYRQTGREADAQALLARFTLAAEAAPAEVPAVPAAEWPPPPAAPAPDLSFDEFEIDVPAPAPVPEAGGAGQWPQPAPAPPPPAGSDSDFVSYEELGSLLQDEMQKAGDLLPPPPAPAPAAVDETSLFADEQQFFNLAEELEKELSQEIPPPPEAPAMSGPKGEAPLEEMFREFKKGVEQQLSAEDYETHFNLGIAYKEMGLIDEAIGEFQRASKDSSRMVECCSMLGLCFLEKGMPQLAIKWYKKGLEAPDIKEVETVGLLYDLGCLYQSTGEADLAHKTLLEVYGLNANYREIVHRVKELEAVKKT